MKRCSDEVGDSPTYDGLMSVDNLINLLHDKVPDRNTKVMLGILTTDGNNPRMKCSIRAVHDDVWKLPLVEIVGQPIPGETR